MNLPALIVTDLHLTAKPDDEYRWTLFPWLQKQCQELKIETLLILGDTTDAKDYHSSTLVNRVVDNILETKKYVPEINILLGNHDYLRDGHPFFHFLNKFDGIRFIDKPLGINTNVDMAALYLPHTKNLGDWDKFDFAVYDYVFMHQTVQGSIASNGQAMDGEITGDSLGQPQVQIYSGDIHVPQDIGNVRYVGSPYHVHFGDKFLPRCIHIDANGEEHDLHFKTLSRTSIKATSAHDFLKQIATMKKGDQIKVLMELSQEDKFDWDSIRKEILGFSAVAGITVHDFKMKVRPARKVLYREAKEVTSQVSTDATLLRFVQIEELGGDVLDVGLEIIG